MADFSVHWNGHMMAAVDVETTGLIPGHHDIIQVCVMPVDSTLRPNKKIFPFITYLQPKRPENAGDDPVYSKITRSELTKAAIDGMDPWSAADRFDEWFNRLRLSPGKMLIPLGANYDAFDRPFMIDWLGFKSYTRYFRSDSRDVQRAALFLNDCADWHSEKIPFSKVKLSYLCNVLNVTNMRPHEATSDCLATIDCYRELMKFRNHVGLL